VFLGLTVPLTRRIAHRFRDLSLPAVRMLLASVFHEVRLAALFILVAQFENGDEDARKAIYELYLAQTSRINNWDLVDGSAHQVVGGWLVERSRRPLYRLARSRNLWERRIAIIATYHFIKRDDLDDTFALADVLLADKHDLIHKAVGWMLREAGKRDGLRLEDWLKPRYQRMPRTMLRYSIEKFPPARRKAYLRGAV
jgi:3-methyladenine DNA glycosylase AlkD